MNTMVLAKLGFIVLMVNAWYAHGADQRQYDIFSEGEKVVISFGGDDEEATISNLKVISSQDTIAYPKSFFKKFICLDEPTANGIILDYKRVIELKCLFNINNRLPLNNLNLLFQDNRVQRIGLVELANIAQDLNMIRNLLQLYANPIVYNNVYYAKDEFFGKFLNPLQIKVSHNQNVLLERAKNSAQDFTIGDQVFLQVNDRYVEVKVLDIIADIAFEHAPQRAASIKDLKKIHYISFEDGKKYTNLMRQFAYLESILATNHQEALKSSENPWVVGGYWVDANEKISYTRVMYMSKKLGRLATRFLKAEHLWLSSTFDGGTQQIRTKAELEIIFNSAVKLINDLICQYNMQ